MRRLILLCAIVVCAITSELQAQRIADNSQSENSQTPFVEGCFIKAYVPTMQASAGIVRTVYSYRISDPVDYLSVLHDEAVFEALELSAQDTKRLKQILQQADSFVREAATKVQSSTDPVELRELARWHQSKSGEIKGELEEVLTSEQIDYLKGAKQQFLLRQLGMKSYLERLESQGEIELSSKERRRLLDTSKNELNKHSVDGEDFVRSVLTELLDALPQSKRDRIDLDLFLEHRALSLDVMCAELAMTRNSIRKVDSAIELLSRPAIYVPGEDGTPMFYQRGLLKLNMTRDLERLSGREELLLYLLSGRVELSASQQDRLDFFAADITAKRIEWAAFIAESPNPWFASESVIDFEDHFCKELDSEMRNLFTAEEMSRIERTIRENAADRFGLPYSLAYGSLREELKLSTAEVATLESRFKSLHKRCQKELRSVVDQINDKLLAELESKNRRVVLERLGGKIDAGGACFFVVSFQ